VPEYNGFVCFQPGRFTVKQLYNGFVCFQPGRFTVKQLYNGFETRFTYVALRMTVSEKTRQSPQLFKLYYKIFRFVLQQL